MSKFRRKEIKQVVERYKGRFSPKYQAFNILRNKVEEVVTESKKIWKIIYGLSTKPIEVEKDASLDKPAEATPKETEKTQGEEEVVKVVEVEVEKIPIEV